MTEEQSDLYAASVAKMRSQITGKAAAAARDPSHKGCGQGAVRCAALRSWRAGQGEGGCLAAVPLVLPARPAHPQLPTHASLHPRVRTSPPALLRSYEKFLRTLGAKKISHMFTHLRKIAQHPLLVRSQYSDEAVAALAKMAFDR